MSDDNHRPVSKSAQRLLFLRSHLEVCHERGWHNEAVLTYYRLREEAAYLIGYGT